MKTLISGILLLLLLIGMFTLAFDTRPALAQAETVYINSDGSVAPSSAPVSSLDNVTYTLTGNISFPTFYGIVVERSSIVVDGNGYTVKGNKGGTGLNLTDVSNVTVRNTNIEAFQDGIYLWFSDNDLICGNNLTANFLGAWWGMGIHLLGSNNTVITANNATGNCYGIFLEGPSDNNLISGNNATANWIAGITIDSSSNNTVSGNVAVNNQNWGYADGMGIYLLGSNNNMICGNNATGSTHGIYLWGSNNTVIGNNATANTNGFVVYSSSNDKVSGNSAIANRMNGIAISSTSNDVISENNADGNSNGIVLASSRNNVINGNNSTGNSDVGIYLMDYSGKNVVSGNDVNANYYGINLCQSSNNTVSGNNALANDYYGVGLNSSSWNIITANKIANNNIGLQLLSASENTVCHSSFIGNHVQTILDSGSAPNVWNDVYPSGGNYWSDYTGIDMQRGIHQNESGSDGIGDTAYLISKNNTDFYPLMTPPSSFHDIAITNVESSKTVVGQGYGLKTTVTTSDLGDYPETFNIIAYANKTSAATLTVTLSSRNSQDTAFTWKTTGFDYGNYTLSACAVPVSGETNTANNNCTEGWVQVSIPGDLNGDFKVNLVDLVTLAVVYGSKPSDLKWNGNADIDGSGIVGLADLVILAQHYGQHYP